MEMYFKRMKDEWTGLVEQADPPIRAKAAEIAVAHAHYLSIEFYRIVRIDPHAEGLTRKQEESSHDPTRSGHSTTAFEFPRF
ncbi:diguanylate cyclase [Shigella dysenteriae]|uniref:Diguanylate cyclase n=1 Tax=Shigella dysenteriae TaxID=622 RepID=A0A2X2K8B3_SHIDY|nr:diguanylate cyclase [Shigella dysenteriae]